MCQTANKSAEMVFEWLYELGRQLIQSYDHLAVKSRPLKVQLPVYFFYQLLEGLEGGIAIKTQHALQINSQLRDCKYSNYLNLLDLEIEEKCGTGHN